MKSENKSILVVDDEALVSRFIVAALADTRYAVTVVGDGEEALKIIRQVQYDLLIVDIKMPKMNGMEFYTNLLKTMPEMTHKMIIMTGDVMGSETSDFLDETKLPYIMKPFDTTTLHNAITSLLGKQS